MSFTTVPTEQAGNAPRPALEADHAATPCIAALVLAAGSGSRMGGQHKLLREIAGRPMVRHVVEAALGSRCAQVLVVTGCQADAVEAVLDPERLSMVRNPDHADGLSSSLRVGLAALPSETQAVLILLGDMPRVSSAQIDRILAAFDPEHPAILIPTHAGRRGNPVLWPRRIFGDLRRLQGDIGGRVLLERLESEILPIPIDSDAIFADVDTPSDLLELATA